MITPIEPAIYKLKYDNNKGYYLDYYKPVFDVSGKNYGSIDKHVNLVWDTYQKSSTSIGVMLIGSAGSGKTRVAELLGNRGINHGMAVVLVTDITVKIDLIPFIDNLYNMVVIFDEFSKNFDLKIQNKMLTMFSSVGGNKKLFIITENDRNTISPFIRTRPGRVRYSIDYDRIKPEVIEEYCKDYNVSEAFKKHIYDIYSSAPKFTFDHLQALVSEHLSHPEFTIDDLIEVLNIDDLVKPETWYLTKIIDKNDDKIKWKPYNTVSFTKDKLDPNLFRLWIDIEEVVENKEDSGMVRSKQETHKISLNNLVKIDDEESYHFESDGIVFIFEKRK